MVGRPSVKHARPVVLDIVNNGIGKSHARIVNNIAHGTRAGNVLCHGNVCCKGSYDDQDSLPYFMDPHGVTPSCSHRCGAPLVELTRTRTDKRGTRRKIGRPQVR
jgi:hypothetical protein